MPKVRFWKTFSIFPFSDGNKGGWLEGWMKAGGWLNSETRCSSSSLPWALVFLLSSCGPYLHPGVLQSQWSPSWELVSGLGRMKKVPDGLKHLWSYRHAGEINMKNRVLAALSGVSHVSLWPRGLQTSKGQALPGPLSCSQAPQTGPQSLPPLAVCGSAEGDLSPNNTQCPECWKTAKRNIPFSWFFFLHKIDIPPTFCLWLFKKQFGSSAFDSFSILKLGCCLFPNQFLHLTKRQYDLYFPLPHWFALITVSPAWYIGTCCMNISFSMMYSVSNCLNQEQRGQKQIPWNNLGTELCPHF